MLSHCECGKGIKSLNVDPLFCTCGKDYRLINIIDVKQNKDNHNIFLYLRMMDKENQYNNSDSNLLCSLPVDAAIELMFRFSKVVLNLNRVRTNTNSQAYFKDTILLHSLLDEVYRGFSSWPRNFQHLLKRLDYSIFNDTLIGLLNDLRGAPFSAVNYEISVYLKQRTYQIQLGMTEFNNEIVDLLIKSMSQMSDAKITRSGNED